jgi:hypothetical protein
MGTSTTKEISRKDAKAQGKEAKKAKEISHGCC